MSCGTFVSVEGSQLRGQGSKPGKVKLPNDLWLIHPNNPIQSFVDIAIVKCLNSLQSDMIFVKTFTLADFAKFKNLPKESA